MKLKIIEVKIGKMVRPVIAVYKNGNAVINKCAVIDFELKNFKYFKAGVLKNQLYLIPTNETEFAQKCRHTMTEGCLLSNAEWNKAIGLEPRTKYLLDKIQDDEGLFLKLTKL